MDQSTGAQSTQTDRNETPDRPYMKFDSAFGTRCANAFYKRLFNLIPGSEEMFGDRRHQHIMFAKILAVITAQASEPDALAETLEELGAKHREMGVLSLHLKVARQAFLGAVEEAEPDITEKELSFFSNAYDAVLAAMR